MFLKNLGTVVKILELNVVFFLGKDFLIPFRQKKLVWSKKKKVQNDDKLNENCKQR